MKNTLFIFALLLFNRLYTQTFSFQNRFVNVGQVKTIWEVYFELGKSELMQNTAQLELDSLVEFLKLQPNVYVEIGVHSDFRGDDKLNLKLTEERSVSIGNYLSSHGIPSSQFITKGYGETQPTISKTEWDKIMSRSSHSAPKHANKRVTIKILKT